MKELVYRECANSDFHDTTWFQLDSIAAYFFRKKNVGYLRMPPLSESCASNDKSDQVAIICPAPNSEIMVLIGLDGDAKRVQLQAVSGNDSELFWHLDEMFLCTTKSRHDATIHIPKGNHVLIVLDQNGNVSKCSFKVYQG